MTKKFRFNSLLVYSEKHNKYHYTAFDKHINLIHGPNTSGKSTLLQSLIYTFGINDVKANLRELLDFNVLFRLDITISLPNGNEDITIIRDSGSLYIKRENLPIRTFHGIDGDTAAEHVKLKHYFHDLFEFDLMLESKDDFKSASIEVIFLPYYISQAVGWVYLRKSFSSLDYYRNFKNDFLDYYLGIISATDREKKKELEEAVLKLQKEETFFIEMEKSDQDLQVLRISDEDYTEKSLAYLKGYSINHQNAAEAEKEFLIKSNELAYLSERKSVVSRVKINHDKQKPSIDHCPVCEQTLPYTFESEYIHLQETNDTVDQLEKIKAKMNKVQSELNSLQKTIEKEKNIINQNYQIFKSYSERGLSMDNWLNQKANIQLEKNIRIKLGDIAIALSKNRTSLEAYKTEAQVEDDRKAKSNLFAQMLRSYLIQLNVKALDEDRFTSLYKISSFPYQGVELHVTVMAYHFALNNLIAGTANIHRLPFVLDGVFKEDVDDESKDLIVKFISKNRPKDTQIFFSVAEKTDKPSQVARYNKQYFNGEAKQILIGDGKSKRSLLKDYDNSIDSIIQDTIGIINNHP